MGGFRTIPVQIHARLWCVEEVNDIIHVISLSSDHCYRYLIFRCILYLISFVSGFILDVWDSTVPSDFGFWLEAPVLTLDRLQDITVCISVVDSALRVISNRSSVWRDRFTSSDILNFVLFIIVVVRLPLEPDGVGTYRLHNLHMTNHVPDLHLVPDLPQPVDAA